MLLKGKSVELRTVRRALEEVQTRFLGLSGAQATAMETEQWLAIRKEAGLRIDPETAKVYWEYMQVGDPYGVLDLPKECDCVGRYWFASSPESDGWVWFGDLPDATREVLKKRSLLGWLANESDEVLASE
jgi:hypothetical protein